MMAENYPVSLEQLVFTRSIVLSVEGYDPTVGTTAPPPNNNIGIQKIDESGRKYQVSMRCLLNENGEKNCPYIIDIECHAILSVNDTLSEEKANEGVTVIGHSVCYGAIRETVAWLTGRQVFGQLMLGLSILGGKPPELAEAP